MLDAGSAPFPPDATVSFVEDAAAALPSAAAAPALSDAAPDGGSDDMDAGPYWPLGMNDITILTPPPGDGGMPVLLRASDRADDGTPLISRALYETVAVEPVCYRLDDAGTCPSSNLDVLPPFFYEDFHLVALRFDLCDRNMPGPCAVHEDGRLRLVFQPLLGQREFFDAALHAFYSIPRARLAAVVGALRVLAKLQAEPVEAPLKPSPALSDPAKSAYAEGLRALVREYASEAKLVRLTLNAQPSTDGVRWVLRGIERAADGSFRKPEIFDSKGTAQLVILSGPDFQVMPATDKPVGFATALADGKFAAASEAQQRTALEALLEVNNPLRSAPGTQTCATCHVATVRYAALTSLTRVHVDSLSGGYTSAYNLSVAAGAVAGNPRVVRALGYTMFNDSKPLISTRVVNETAQVLSEIEQRFR